MARIKRQRNARSRQRMKRRNSRDLNIPELIYKFLVAEDKAARDAEGLSAARCRCCDHGRPHDEVVESASAQSTDEDMGYRARKNTGRISKSRGIKRRPRTSKDLPISYLQKCVGAEGTRKARKYIQKALNFGVESGYLIPSDPTYKILRVSSDLIKDDSQKGKPSTCDKERETPSKLEDLQVQEQRRRRRRRRGRRSRSRRSRSPLRRGRRRRSRRGRRGRRRRSRSRSRGGRSRYNSPQNPVEVAEDDAAVQYEIDENDSKGNIHTSGVDREPKSTRSRQLDEEQSKKTDENDTDLSVDENESDDEDGKNRADITAS